MSEHHQPRHEYVENLPKTEHLKGPEQHHNQHERELTHAEKQHGNKEHLDNIQKSVEQQALSASEHSLPRHEQANHHPVIVNKQLKDLAFTRAMTRARKKLSIPSRAFSKIVHSPAIDSSSEFIGKTAARPSSMLGGALFAFVGTSYLLWATKHYGYEYNYLLVILLFVGGAIIGLVSEVLLNLRHRKHS